MNTIITEDLNFIVNSNVDWKKFRNTTVFITGAYGMLLSYITYTLLHLNIVDPTFNVTVIALIRDTEKAKKRFGSFIGSKHLKLFKHDLVLPITIHDDIDYIIHGASYASPHHFATNPIGVLLPNTLGTYHTLELAKAKKIKNFLFFSSGSVYGKASTVVTEKEYGYLDPLDSMSCYGESKRMAENMCACYVRHYGIPVKIVRPAHIYGPTMDIENDSRVFAHFVNCIMKGKNIVMKSDGSTCRSFCYIADATVAYFKVLLDGTSGEAYNVGNDAAYMPVKQLAELFVATFPEKQLKVIIEKNGNNQQSDSMLMSSRKVKQLGWKCAFTVEDGIKRTINSYVEQYQTHSSLC